MPPWVAAVEGRPDWSAIYSGYESDVDWRTAGFCRELATAYPSARFVLTVRRPESWAASFSETIGKVMLMADQLPDETQDWLRMAIRVRTRTGLPAGLGKAELEGAFRAPTEGVKAAVPAERLLVYDVKEGWEPLCRFLGLPVPEEPLPRTNGRVEFWDPISQTPSRAEPASAKGTGDS